MHLNQSFDKTDKRESPEKHLLGSYDLFKENPDHVKTTLYPQKVSSMTTSFPNTVCLNIFVHHYY